MDEHRRQKKEDPQEVEEEEEEEEEEEGRAAGNPAPGRRRDADSGPAVPFDPLGKTRASSIKTAASDASDQTMSQKAQRKLQQKK